MDYLEFRFRALQSLAIVADGFKSKEDKENFIKREYERHYGKGKNEI